MRLWHIVCVKQCCSNSVEHCLEVAEQWCEGQVSSTSETVAVATDRCPRNGSEAARRRERGKESFITYHCCCESYAMHNRRMKKQLHAIANQYLAVWTHSRLMREDGLWMHFNPNSIFLADTASPGIKGSAWPHFFYILCSVEVWNMLHHTPSTVKVIWSWHGRLYIRDTLNSFMTLTPTRPPGLSGPLWNALNTNTRFQRVDLLYLGLGKTLPKTSVKYVCSLLSSKRMFCLQQQ